MLKPGANIFVTGATGLIGGELVRSLLNSGLGNLWTLVRPREGVSPGDRLRSRLLRSARGEPERADAALHAVSGDMAEERLGLSEADYRAISSQADVIIHCAAETSFLREDSCRRNNVVGTQRMLEFVRGCERSPLLVYVSTAYVSGCVANARISEDDSLLTDNSHHNEYTRSKAQAEELVRGCGLRTLIVRPSVVVSAGLDDPDFASAILGFLPLLNEFDGVPIDPKASPDVVPVQFVVDSILRLLEKPRLRYNCYHVSADEPWSACNEDLGEVLHRCIGRTAPLLLVPPSEWTREHHREFVRTPQQRRVFGTLKNYLPFLNMNIHFANSRLRNELGDRFPPLVPLTAYLGELLLAMGARRESAMEVPASLPWFADTAELRANA